MRTKLSNQVINEAEKTGLIWDTVTVGLGLRVYPSGRKGFVYRYYHRAKQRMIKIGRYGDLTLTQARDVAKIHALTLAKGGDPGSIAGGTRTFASVADSYINLHARPKKKSWEDDVYLLDKYVLKRWGEKQIGEIDGAAASRLHDEITQKGPTTANRVRSLVSKIFSFAISRGYLPAGTPNPIKGVEKNKEKGRDVYVNLEQIPALWSAINQEPNEHVKAIFKLYVLTGARKSELLNLRFRQIVDVDTEAGKVRAIYLPDTKGGRPHFIPLGTRASKIIADLPQRGDDEFIFVGWDWKKPLHVDSAWQRIRKRAGLTDVRIHDLRHTAATLMGHQGQSREMIGQILNQSNLATTGRYLHWGIAPALQALEKHGELLAEHVVLE